MREHGLPNGTIGIDPSGQPACAARWRSELPNLAGLEEHPPNQKTHAILKNAEHLAAMGHTHGLKQTLQKQGKAAAMRYLHALINNEKAIAHSKIDSASEKKVD